jgi:predicted ATPase
LAQRVGIVTGEVAVTVGATAEGMVAGDAVNTAARVQSAAAPGQVWVDEATRGLASAAITFTDVGEHELKGKAEPVRLFEAGVVVSAVGGAQRVDGLEAPFTGRDADLRLVKELFHATQESGRPRLVVLDGEAGVGKSRLAWEFEKYIDGLTVTTWWHRGRCLSYGDGVAFWALAEAIRARFGLVEADSGVTVTERLDAGLAEYVTETGEREWLRPRLAVLLGEAGAGSFAREDLFAAWTAFLEHLARDDASVVLVLDDAQHADDGLLDFLDHLLATARASIFVLALARPDLLRRRPDLGGRRATIVRLEPLDDDAMANLVDGLVADLPTTARSALVERAEGIPLFAVETVRALIDRDLVIPRDGRYVPADGVVLDLDAIGAPATLQALVAARLDALNAEEKRVVADASVLGLTFTRDGLLALGSTAQTLETVLDSLRRREILSVQSDRFSAERGQYRFVQSVVRQVAYATMSKRDRKTRHVAADDHLATEPDPADDLAVVIAQHLLDAIQAAPDTDPDTPDLTTRAVHYLERAALRAAAIGAPAEAQNLLELALTRTHDPADQARLHLASARAANTAGDLIGARDHAERATVGFDELGDDVEAGRAAAAHATAVMPRSRSRSPNPDGGHSRTAATPTPPCSISLVRSASATCASPTTTLWASTPSACCCSRRGRTTRRPWRTLSPGWGIAT